MIVVRKVVDRVCDLAKLTQYDDDYYLILARETTPKCNLDLYWSDGKKWFFDGFELFNIKPLIDSFINQGIEFEECGYQEDINLKRLAVRAGIGSPGKNSLVVTSKYGSRLRFKAIKLAKRLDGFESIINPGSLIFDKCALCNLCVDHCNNNCLNPLATKFNLADRKQCKAYLELENPTGDDSSNRCTTCASFC